MSDTPMICENGVMRPATEAELQQMAIDEQYQNTVVLPKQIRDKRNALLVACDWTQVADAPVDKEAWATYRQALRDITTQPEFPLNIVFPNEPQSVIEG